MCDQCKAKYEEQSDETKDDLEGNARMVAHAALAAWREAGVDLVTIAAALGVARRLIHAQMDAGTLAVVDAIADRAFAVVAAEYRERGLSLEPRPHSPMDFVVVERTERLRVNGDRPARAAEPGAPIRRSPRRS